MPLTLQAMIINIIMWPFSILVYRARKARTVSQDLSNILKWTYQSYKDRKNNNTLFLKLLEASLKGKSSESQQATVRLV